MTIVRTVAGDVEGGPSGGVLRFAGIPYAAPPVGPLRFAPPQPREPWPGIRPATEAGPISLQNAAPLQDALGAPPLARSEDCLSLTVTTPAADSARRPVMVWIHGGGFVIGSGSSPIWDGRRLAGRGDVVVVSINYRLGALGFLHLAELDPDLASSGLNGILDQVAALAWVRDNIAAFGGDPSNVTVFGASAGAMSIGALLVMPAARGLFHRAILQSGAGQGTLSPRTAAAHTRCFCDLTGCSTVDDLRALDGPAILEAQATLGSPGPDWQRGFQPVVDGHHLVASPLDAAHQGDLAAVDLLLGTTDHEWRMFSFAEPGPDADDALAESFAGDLRDPGAAIATYRARLGPDAPTGVVYDAMMTDREFRVPMQRLADASVKAGNPTWVYRFGYRTPIADGMLGSCHALDVPFVFDNRDGNMARFVGADSPDSLAHAMQRSWVAFARTGDPNHDAIPSWEPQGDRRPVIRFDAVTTMTDDPEPDELALWADGTGHHA